MRNPAIQRFLASYRLELRLISLHWSYGLIYAAWAVFVLSNLRRPILEPARILLFSGIGMGTVAVVSLISLAMAGVSASRSDTTRFVLLETAFPTGIEVVIGRWLAVFTALIAFAIVPLVVTLIIGPIHSFLSALPLFIGETLLIFAFVTGLVWVIHAIVGIRRWMYPLFVALWIGSALARNLYSDQGLQLPGANLLAFASGNFGSYSEAFGRLQWGNLPLLYDLFYLGLVLTLIGVLSWYYQVRRFHHPLPVIMTMTTLTTVFTLATGTVYIGEVAAANQQIRDASGIIRPNIAQMQAPAQLPYTFSNYDIIIDMDTPSAPEFQVQVQAVNVGDEPLVTLDYSLNAQLNLTISNLPYERSGHLIHVTLPQPLQPGETTLIQVVYSGTMWRYVRQFATPPIAADFTHIDGINLTAESLWYPVPGLTSPGVRFTEARGGVYQDSVLYHLAIPTSVQLQVLNPGTFHYASNLPAVSASEFRSEGTLAVDLVGTPNLATRTSGNVTLIAAQTEIEPLATLVNEWFIPAWDTVQFFFPENEKLVLIAIKERSEYTAFETVYPSTAENLVVRVDPLILYRLPEGEDSLARPFIYLLDSLLYDAHPHLHSGIYQFLWLYLIEDGDPQRMEQRFRQEIQSANPFGRYSFVRYTDSLMTLETRYGVTEALIALYTAEGDDAIRVLFERIQAENSALKDLTPEALAAWVEDAANAD
jgi:hypothetical protein